MISENLLSEVLPNTERYTYKFMNKEPVQVDHKWQGIVGTLNLYELAHKCKKWAWDKGYTLQIMWTDDGDEDVCWVEVSVWERENFLQKRQMPSPPNTPETELIFQACEWILMEVRNVK